MIDKIYEDFTTKLLPKISNGLVISKDYFTELFGRYVKYLIITDTMQVTLLLILLTASSIVLYKGIKVGKENQWSAGAEIPLIMFGAIGILMSIIAIPIKSNDIVKDLYIPEIRVYEVIKMKL